MTRIIMVFLTVVSLAVSHGVAQGEEIPLFNKQAINKPNGDMSIVQQKLEPGAYNNQQSAAVASQGQPPNVVVQSTGGGGNVQIVVQQGGGGNFISQTQRGTHGRQTIIQTGEGNRAIQNDRN